MKTTIESRVAVLEATTRTIKALFAMTYDQLVKYHKLQFPAYHGEVLDRNELLKSLVLWTVEQNSRGLTGKD